MLSKREEEGKDCLLKLGLSTEDKLQGRRRGGKGRGEGCGMPQAKVFCGLQRTCVDFSGTVSSRVTLFLSRKWLSWMYGEECVCECWWTNGRSSSHQDRFSGVMCYEGLTKSNANRPSLHKPRWVDSSHPNTSLVLAASTFNFILILGSILFQPILQPIHPQVPCIPYSIAGAALDTRDTVRD